MTRYYRLDDAGEAVPATPTEWAIGFNDGEGRTVARDLLPGGGVVSTVFLGVDHRVGPDGPPLIWETMTFAVEHPAIDNDTERCSTRAQAIDQHATALAAARAHVAACDGGCRPSWDDE